VKQEAKLSASEVPGEVVGSGEKDLRCRSLLTVCQRRLGLLEAKDTVQGWSSTVTAVPPTQEDAVLTVGRLLLRVCEEYTQESTRLASLYEVYYFTQFTASRIIVTQRYCLPHLFLIPSHFSLSAHTDSDRP